MVVVTTTTGRPLAVATALLTRYLSQALLLAIFGFLVSHHFVLLQWDAVASADKNLHPDWAPSKASFSSSSSSSYSSSSSSSSWTTNKNNKNNNLTQSVPPWLIEYAEWHDQMRQRGDWSKQNVLVVVAKDELAEGLADRLRSLPFLLWEAYKTKRVLFIQWLRPYPLEEFLLPPANGGIDWRLPRNNNGNGDASLLNLDEPSPDVVWHEYPINFTSIAEGPYQNYRVVKTQPNPTCFFEGMEYVYSTLLQNGANTVDEQLSRIYHLLLTPAPPVQRLLDETMQRLGLVPKQYIGVHLRARYPDYVVQFHFTPNGWNGTDLPKPKIDELGRRNILLDPNGLAVDRAGIMETKKVVSQLSQLTSRAIRCARANLPHAMPPTPIYFASDTNLAIKLAINASEHIVGSITSNERLHMNVDNEHQQYKPADFYPAIVDSWILSQARCLAAGQGGYTLFAAVLGGSGNCMVFHAMQNLYAARYLPQGYVTIRNITFCKPQKDKMVRKLKNLIQAKEWEEKAKPRKSFLSKATWNVGN